MFGHTLVTDEWECFIEAVVTGFCDHLRELAARDRNRLDAMTAEVKPRDGLYIQCCRQR